MKKIRDQIIQYAKSVQKFRTSDAVKALGNKYSRVYISRALNSLYKRGELLRGGAGAHIYYALPGSAGILFKKNEDVLIEKNITRDAGSENPDGASSPLKLKDATPQDLYDISLASAKARSRSLLIYEKGNLSDAIGHKKAEELRNLFLANKINIKQVTNTPLLPPFSKNDQFINSCMTFRYVPEDLFTIENEILIFDDTVAFYTIGPRPKLAVIEDKSFADSQKQLFLNLWDQGQPPKLGFKYEPNHSYYRNFDYEIENKHIIVYPDKDAVKAYHGFNHESLGKYLTKIIKKNSDYVKDADYLIVFIWSFEGNKMVDIWRFNYNFVDDRSGPLCEGKVFKNGMETKDLGLASGSTLLILGYEEKLRRQSADLNAYFQGPPPDLPLEVINRENFFEAMKKFKK